MSDTPDELSVLAGEYVLGVLEGNEIVSVLRQAEIDPQFAAAISAWELHLAPLAELVSSVTPPAIVWSRLEQSIGMAETVAPPSGFRRTVQGIRFWRGTTIGALALAAAFAAVAYLPRGETPPRMAALAQIGAPAPAFLAEARDDGSIVLTALNPAPVPAGRDLELWLLPKGATAVASLGVLPRTGRRLTGPALQDGAQLLVSLEQAGGSPTGQPTGPVLYGGTLITR